MATITSAMSDTAVAEELFQRLEKKRKARKLTQVHFAQEYLGVTVKTYRTLREGRCTLTIFLTALRQLGLLENLNLLVPEQAVKPTDVLKSQQASKRRRTERLERAGVDPDLVNHVAENSVERYDKPTLASEQRSGGVRTQLNRRRKLKTQQDMERE